MSGHSHYANTKWKKERSAQERSKLHQRARKELELYLTQGGRIEEALKIARKKYNLPSEKVWRIWEKLQQEKGNKIELLQYLYQAPFNIIIYCEANDNEQNIEILEALSKELNLKDIGKVNLLGYFQKVHCLEIQSKDFSVDIGEQVISTLSEELIDEIENIEIKDKEKLTIYSNKKTHETIEDIFSNVPYCFIKNKNFVWKPLVTQELVDKESQDYAKSLKQRLNQEKSGIRFFLNIE